MMQSFKPPEKLFEADCKHSLEVTPAQLFEKKMVANVKNKHLKVNEIMFIATVSVVLFN